MELNSCLYETEIMHHRLAPKRHRFVHKIFMFYIDLDELDVLSKNSWFFKYNKRAWYQFLDNDHIGHKDLSVRLSVKSYLHEQGIDLGRGSIKLLTNVRTFGYVFNPVSFFYCFREDGSPLCVVVEIGNTFKEQKYFLIRPENFTNDSFQDEQSKYFYISPFIDLDNQMQFRIQVPESKLMINIDTLKDNAKVLVTSMRGKKLDFTSRNLAWMTLKFPFVTLKVIGLIHWHALCLFLKRVPHWAKEANLHLQRGVHHERNSNQKEKQKKRSKEKV